MLLLTFSLGVIYTINYRIENELADYLLKKDFKNMKLFLQLGTGVLVGFSLFIIYNTYSIYGFKSLDALSLSLAKPFSEERDGINLGEGCCVLILENQTYAQNRGATSYGEVVGYGLSNDAYHMTSPIPDGTGALSAMMQTTENKNISKDNSLYINAHGTGTKANDVMESKAIASFLSETELKCHISSTKSMTGHCLGAAGAVELGLSLIYQMSELKPITANSDERLLTELSSMNDQGFNYKYTLSNSFAFGGSNASILIKNLPTKQEQSNEY